MAKRHKYKYDKITDGLLEDLRSLDNGQEQLLLHFSWAKEAKGRATLLEIRSYDPVKGYDVLEKNGCSLVRGHGDPDVPTMGKYYGAAYNNRFIGAFLRVTERVERRLRQEHAAA